MNKKLKNIVIAVAVIIVILLVLPHFINVNSFRPKIESELSSALGRKAEIGDLSLSILRGSVSAANISIADDPAFSQEPFLTAKGLKIGVRLVPLIFSRKLNITGITLDEPSIALISKPGGKWNFSSLGGNKPKQEPKSEPKSGGTLPDNFSVAKLQVTGGKLQMSEANSAAKPLTIENVDIEVNDFSSTTQFPFTLTAELPGSGDLKLEGKAGPLAPAGTPIQASLGISKLDLAGLGANPGMGLGGIGNLDGTLDSDGTTAKVRGTLSLDKLKLSPKGTPAGREIQVKIATDYDIDKQTGTLSQGEISVGKALAHLSGSYQTVGEVTQVNMILNAPALPVGEVAALLPALGVTLPAGSTLKGGTLSVRLDIKGPTDKLVITGPVKLENTSLAGFDLGSKLSAISAFTGKAKPSGDTSIQNASMNTRMAPEGTRLDSIDVTVPALGALTGAGSVSPEGALNFRLAANLSGGAAGGLTQAAGLGRGNSGGGIPFAIVGTTANPKFVPDVKGMAGNAAQDAIGGALGTKGESTKKGLGGLFRKK
jgi:AsmA protein